jgi:hypothetical protein
MKVRELRLQVHGCGASCLDSIYVSDQETDCLPYIHMRARTHARTQLICRISCSERSSLTIVLLYLFPLLRNLFCEPVRKFASGEETPYRTLT